MSYHPRCRAGVTIHRSTAGQVRDYLRAIIAIAADCHLYLQVTSLRPGRCVKKMKTSALPQWLLDLATARMHYEERFGWPVSISVVERQLAIALGHTLDAITLPAPLAGQVQAQLGIAMLAGPVIANPDGTHWTFLTQPAPPDLGTDLPGVRRGGTHTVIPTDGTSWRWIKAPGPKHVLPSVHAVVATTRRILAAQNGI